MRTTTEDILGFFSNRGYSVSLLGAVESFVPEAFVVHESCTVFYSQHWLISWWDEEDGRWIRDREREEKINWRLWWMIRMNTQLSFVQKVVSSNRASSFFPTKIGQFLQFRFRRLMINEMMIRKVDHIPVDEQNRNDELSIRFQSVAVSPWSQA